MPFMKIVEIIKNMKTTTIEAAKYASISNGSNVLLLFVFLVVFEFLFRCNFYFSETSSYPYFSKTAFTSSVSK